MTRQLIISGFHRSGTSMTMQYLVRAGLHAGEQLAQAHPSNPDGHFEDIEAVKLHDRWLAENDTDWCYIGDYQALLVDDAKSALQPIIKRLSTSESSWGIKDPRALLFLPHWFDALQQPGAILVYRHYGSCFHSLRQRQAQNLLHQPSAEYSSVRFWTDPMLSLRSWLTYNRALIAHVQQFPVNSLLVAQDAILSGFNLPAAVNKQFDMRLNEQADSGVDRNNVRSQYSITIPRIYPALHAELEYTWNLLQQLSQVPATGIVNIDWQDNSLVDEPAECSQLNALTVQWDKLEIPKNTTFGDTSNGLRTLSANLATANNVISTSQIVECVSTDDNQSINYQNRPVFSAAVQQLYLREPSCLRVSKYSAR